MQRGLGIVAIFAALVAGARFTASPSLSKTSETPAPVSAHHVAAGAQPAETSCAEFSEHTGQGGSTTGEIAALIDRYRDIVPGHAPAQWKLPVDTKILLITVPDPLHTHLNLQFDRTMDAVQDAAQDENFTYNSSWLPWKTQMHEFSDLGDLEKEEEATHRRELCPGLILFRHNVQPATMPTAKPQNTAPAEPGSDEDTYATGLLVFVVAEKPTTGIDRNQWDNALRWIEEHVDVKDNVGTKDNVGAKDHESKVPDHTLRILGPTFSGSAPSAIRALRDLQNQKSVFTSALLYSGTMRGCSSYGLLKKELRGFETVPVRVADFDQNDAIQIDHYFEFLKERGHDPSEVAILSEDETAYGGLPTQSGNDANKPAVTRACAPAYGSDGPLYLYYPRDISAVRSAYQEQSIFAPPAGSATSARLVLQPQASESTHVDTDSIPSFSGANSALAQEAGLYGVIDSLKAHGVRFVILRATSTLDYLFLTRFLHRAYPEGFIITMGTDILYGRDVDSTEFRGVAALSVFPLLPRGQDWTSGNDSTFRHAHRVFGSDSMEGTYLASRYLMTDAGVSATDTSYHFQPKPGLPDYGPPFWEQGKREPVTWLSVVGRDGYWPVAILNTPYSPNGAQARDITSNLVPLEASTAPVTSSAHVQPWMKFSLSPAWKLVCAVMFLAIWAHLLGCRFLCGRQDLSLFIPFAPLPGFRQLLLMGIGWGIICSAVILMYNCSVPLRAYLQGQNMLWIDIVGFCVGLGFLGILWDMGARSLKEMRSLKPGPPVLVFVIFCIPLLLFAIAFAASHAIFSDMPTAYRAVHVTSGVSPVISLLLMMCGFYWWFWQELSGLTLLGRGKPSLPCKTEIHKALARISSQMACHIEAFAMPLPRPGGKIWPFYVFPLVILGLLFLALLHPFGGNFDSMLHSFENKSFNLTLHAVFAIAVYLLIVECAQLLSTWLGLKRLLLALNRTPLRRTFAALQGLSMHSLWSLSGTTSRSRYTIFSHQLESLFHLKNVLDSSTERSVGNQDLRVQVRKACERGQKFMENRTSRADLAMDNTLKAWCIRQRMSQCAECILKNLLLPDWCEETGTLDLAEGERKDEEKDGLPLSEKKPIRRAEEFVCLIYVGYLQNMLGRMRTMVLAILGLYAALAFSLAFYPYTPRPAIALSLLILLVGIGAVVALVYAGLDRDTTLSRIANTVPGTLGIDFWVRLASFIGVPIVGLLVAQFPEIGDFIASWIQPSISAVK